MNLSKLYSRIIRKIIRVTFRFWERLGIHITADHFYEPVPNTRKLSEKLWQKHSELIGVNTNESLQLHLLSDFKDSYKKEYDLLPKEKTNIESKYYIKNGLYESVDGEILYCMIRHFRPQQIIEIGSGNSTCLAAETILANEKLIPGYKCSLTAIEPYPNETIQKGFDGLTQVVPEPVQNIPYSAFEQLGENDFLLIDSSHVLKTGSDVQYEYLEILPRLRKGVIISFHDIFLPAEYRKNWILKHHKFWNEQYLLQAFLIFNDAFEVLWMGSYMHINHPDLLQQSFNSYNINRDWPGSFWIRKVK